MCCDCEANLLCGAPLDRVSESGPWHYWRLSRLDGSSWVPGVWVESHCLRLQNFFIVIYWNVCFFFWHPGFAMAAGKCGTRQRKFKQQQRNFQCDHPLRGCLRRCLHGHRGQCKVRDALLVFGARYNTCFTTWFKMAHSKLVFAKEKSALISNRLGRIARIFEIDEFRPGASIYPHVEGVLGACDGNCVSLAHTPCLCFLPKVEFLAARKVYKALVPI